MLKTSSVVTLLVLATLAGLTNACSGKRNNSAFSGDNTPVISKDTKTEPQITTVADQFNMAFDELAWTRQSSALSINPPSLSSKEGCVQRIPSKGVRFLVEQFDCKRLSDTSDAQTNHRFELYGHQTSTGSNGMYQIQGTFTKHVYAVGIPDTLVAEGTLTRNVQIAAPTGVAGSVPTDSAALASSVYKVSSKTAYIGGVPAESKDQPESWVSTVQGGVTASTSVPLTILTGTAVSLTYAPEVEVNAKRASQTVALVATTDISFQPNGNCLRPVGTFTWTINQGGVSTSGTLTSTATGYTRSDDGTSHTWGARCLER